MSQTKLMGILAGVLVLAVSLVVFMGIMKSRAASAERPLKAFASELNKTLPKTLEGGIRLESTTGGPGKRFTYFYTLVNGEKKNLNLEKLKDILRKKHLAYYKNSEPMKQFRDHNVEMRYDYKDKNGEELFEIVVSPKDL